MSCKIYVGNGKAYETCKREDATHVVILGESVYYLDSKSKAKSFLEYEKGIGRLPVTMLKIEDHFKG